MAIHSLSSDAFKDQRRPAGKKFRTGDLGRALDDLYADIDAGFNAVTPMFVDLVYTSTGTGSDLASNSGGTEEATFDVAPGSKILATVKTLSAANKLALIAYAHESGGVAHIKPQVIPLGDYHSYLDSGETFTLQCVIFPPTV